MRDIIKRIAPRFEKYKRSGKTPPRKFQKMYQEWLMETNEPTILREEKSEIKKNPVIAEDKKKPKKKKKASMFKRKKKEDK